MVTLTAHFDGKVIIPDEPLTLTPNQRIRISIEQMEPEPKQVDLTWLLGQGNAPDSNPNPSFKNNDDLWDKSK